jgi:paired amphipathic helix protein Sin3a
LPTLTGHNKLILGFNTFLPEGEGYKIELTPEEQNAGNVQAFSNPVANPIMMVNNAPVLGSQPAAPKIPQQMQQQHAISYVTTIRNRFQHEPETYRSFLKILHTYQKEQKGIKDVLEQVSLLFADHPDLLMEFTYFLPDAVQEQAKERLHRAARESEQRRRAQQMAEVQGGALAGIKRQRQAGDKIDKMSKIPTNKPRKQRVDEMPITNSIRGSSLVKDKGVYNMDNRAATINASDHHVSMTAERRFFDQIKDLLTSTSKDGWTEFVKTLELFINDAITKKDLFLMVHDLFGNNNDELFEEFKLLMNNRTEFEANGQDLWYATPLSEIDFTQARKCTPSYRALPADYPKLQFSERSEEEAAVLNDNWVSLPIGSEESNSFKHMRKNQYEEALFKCEDDRFEIDMIIDSNMCTIRVLEPIAEEIKNLRQLEESAGTAGGHQSGNSSVAAALPKFSFQLEKRNLSTVHLNAITRIYGDHGNEILELLKKNPAGTIPLLVNRMLQKDKEWRKAKEELNKVWRELVDKNFEKSFDHRSFYFKQQDKRFYTTKNLVNEIKLQAPEAGMSADELKSIGVYFPSLPNVPNDLASAVVPGMTTHIALTYSNDNNDVHRDIYRLMCATMEAMNIPVNEKERIISLYRDFLRIFFNIPVHYLYDNSAVQAQQTYPIHPSEAWQDGTKVITIFGPGRVISFRSADSMYKVQLPFGVASLRPGAILGAEELSKESLQTLGVTHDNHDNEFICGKPIHTRATNTTSSDLVFYGTQMCYVYLRMHQTIYNRLCVARQLAKDQVNTKSSSDEKLGRRNAYTDALSDDEMDVAAVTAKVKSPYKSFYSQLLALIDGSIDGSKYEESVRHLLGIKAYVIFTIDKVLQRSLKCLQAMASDEYVTKLVGLFVFNNSREGRMDASTYQYVAQQILQSTAEDLYRFQLVLGQRTNYCVGKGITTLCIQYIGGTAGASEATGATRPVDTIDDDENMDVEDK